ncbi:Protein kinase domain [Dillenia turbinata]|uniref:Protein kinase domain n=1 Tax=Dillenia turbinata TaxID=194707 RepID=A0AAN8VA47_9MAGN
MNLAAQLKRGISRQFSMGSLRKSGRFSFKRQSSLDPRRNNHRFGFGRQSSLDPIRRSPVQQELGVPENLDSTMQLLFMACRGDAGGVEDLLNEGIDVNSIDLDGRTALHIAACEGHVDVVKLLLSREANINARDRWGSTAAADAKYYGNVEVYDILRARGAKVPVQSEILLVTLSYNITVLMEIVDKASYFQKTRKTPMTVANPREVPEYELNPLELQIRKSDGISKGTYQVAKWNGIKVAVKILDKDSCSNPENITAFKHELEWLEKVRHPNVVQFVGAVTQNVPMMIVLEYHPKRSELSARVQTRATHSLRFKAQLKIAGFGLIRLSYISPDKVRLVQPDSVDRTSLYLAPEVYNNDVFDRSVDAFSFGILLYEMIEGIPPFHPKSPGEAVKMISVEGKRPPFKIKTKSYPPDLKELIDQCWAAEPSARPMFSEIIIQLDKIDANCHKQGWWKNTFKLPWFRI